MSWIVLLLAGFFEILWSGLLKVVSADQRPSLIALTVFSIIASMALLSVAMKEIPLGTAYAVWTGIGALGAFVVGLIWFQEPLTFGRLCSVALLVMGIVGLKLTSSH